MIKPLVHDLLRGPKQRLHWTTTVCRMLSSVTASTLDTCTGGGAADKVVILCVITLMGGSYAPVLHLPWSSPPPPFPSLSSTRMHTDRQARRPPPSAAPSFSHLLLTLFPTTNMAAKSDGAPVSPRNEFPPECPASSDPRPAPRRRAEQRYSLQDCCWTLCALLVFFSDGASDLWLAADYYLRRDYWCFALTLVFVIVPSVVVQVLSFRWFAYDFSESAESGTAAAAVVAASGAAESDFSTKDSGERGAGRTAAAGVLPGPGTGGGARGCYRAFVWLFQALVHIFQLAQVWR